MILTLTSFDGMMKDMHPRPGTRIKQWVADARREDAWERETCPRVRVESHQDNTGCECRNGSAYTASVPWTHLQHDCCDVCSTLGDGLESRPDIAAWLAERAGRPPIEPDRSKLSDEIEPERPPLRMHPLLGMLPK